MSDLEPIKFINEGVQSWNQWRDNIDQDIEISLQKICLKDKNLSNINFRGVNLMSADLSGSNLKNADLSNARLNDANLENADLTNSKLNATLFIETNLNDAVLTGAHLFGTDFSRANMKRVTLENAKLFQAVFADSDLNSASGLDHCIHEANSSIDSLTLTRSGLISERFLRGCGLPDWLIDAYSLMQPELDNDQVTNIAYKLISNRIGKAIQVSSVFISYSHADESFVNLLCEEFNKKGIRYWRDTHHAPSGRLEKIIDQAIRLNPTVLIILSKNSVESDWVEHEVRLARKLEKDIDKDVMCPIALDDTWKTSKWPRRIRNQVEEYNILDFSNWKQKREFNKMIDRLFTGMSIFYNDTN